MAITIREQQSSGGGSITFTLGAGTLTTDRLLAVQANDYETLSTLTAPTGTAATSWTLQGSVDGGTNFPHMKVWTADVISAGANTVVVNYTSSGGEERYATVFVLTGVAAGIDGVASTASGSAATAHVAPTITPTSGQADDLLICVFCGPLDATSSINYTMPGGMTAYTEQDVGGFITYRAASEQLASSGATGTRTATASTSSTFQTLSVLVKSAAVAAASPRRLRIQSQAVLRASFQ